MKFERYNSQSCRCQSAGPDDYRSITIENNVFPHVDGSSRVKVAESIDILCSVKVLFTSSKQLSKDIRFLPLQDRLSTNFMLMILQLEVAEPNSDCPDEGILEISAEISPSCKVNADQIQSMGAAIGEKLQR